MSSERILVVVNIFNIQLSNFLQSTETRMWIYFEPYGRVYLRKGHHLINGKRDT